MSRFFAAKNLQIVLGLLVAVGIAATRTEKLFAEMQASLPHQTGWVISASGHNLPEPFDPARVPQSGGMASRLLAGISVNVAKPDFSRKLDELKDRVLIAARHLSRRV